MPTIQDGPVSTLFTPLPFKGNVAVAELADIGLSAEMTAAVEHAPTGLCSGWGIPFEIEDMLVLTDQALSIEFPTTAAPWLIFMRQICTPRQMVSILGLRILTGQLILAISGLIKAAPR